MTLPEEIRAERHHIILTAGKTSDDGPIHYYLNDQTEGEDATIRMCLVEDVDAVEGFISDVLKLVCDCSESQARDAIASVGGVKKCPSWYGDLRDAHDCRRHEVGDGYCSVCGAIIPDTPAYWRECACDPPEACDRYEDDDLC